MARRERPEDPPNTRGIDQESAVVYRQRWSRREPGLGEGCSSGIDGGDDTALGKRCGYRVFFDRVYHQRADSGSLKVLVLVGMM